MNRTQLLLLAWLSPLFLTAQSIEITPFIGLMNYEGDMAEFLVTPAETHIAGGIGLRYHLNKAFALRPQVLIGKISGDDRHSSRNFRRHLSFEAPLFEALLFLDYNLFHPKAKHHYGRTSEPRMALYLSLGGGFTLADARLNTEKAPLDAFPTSIPEPDDKAFFSTLGGSVSLAYRISDRTSLSGQFGMRYVFSDYLDGLSINGQPAYNDWYIFAGVGLAVKMEPAVKCPGRF